jgi:ankyrin repeat protein
MRSIIPFLIASLHVIIVVDSFKEQPQYYPSSSMAAITSARRTTQTVTISKTRLYTVQQKKPKIVYKHLFRHYGDISFDSWLRCQEPKAFLLSVGYTENEIQMMEEEYPNILSLNVHDHLAPKIRFLVETLNGGTGRLIWNNDYNEAGNQVRNALEHTDEEECIVSENEEEEDLSAFHSMRIDESTKHIVQPNFFGCQLDRIVGPYHAYLQSKHLPHGRELLDDPDLWNDFLLVCDTKSIQSFVSLCQEWSTRQQQHSHRSSFHKDDDDDKFSVESVETFLRDFSPGIIPAAKGLISYDNNDMIPLMLKHGANPLEYDNHGIIPLFWAAGTGNINAFQVLLESIALEHEYGDSIYDALDIEREPKDGATVLHWACCGVSTEFVGEGGSFDVCRWIIEQAGEDRSRVVNLKTWNSNTSPVMWAAWAGSTSIVDMLVVHGAEIDHIDGHGRNALHWAAAAGQVDVVEYLLDTNKAKALTTQVDERGYTPLDYAKEFGREDVVSCIEQTKEFERPMLLLESTAK